MEAAVRVLVLSQDEGDFSLVQHLIKEDRSIECSYVNEFVGEDIVSNKIIHLFQKTQADVIFLFDSLKQFSIFELIRILKRNSVHTPIIVVSNIDTASFAVEAMKCGAENYLIRNQLTNDRFIEVLYASLQSTKEERLVREIRDENLKLSQVIDQSPVSIMITDAKQGKIEYANPMFTTLTGYSFEEVKGKNPRILKTGVKTKQEYKQFWETILSGKTWKGEFINRKKNGDLYCVAAVVAPIKINNNETTHFVGLHQDITLQKEAELKLKSYAKKLENKSTELENAYQDIERNIQKARRLHRHFFPTNFPKIRGIDFEAYYEPAHKIGSDYYNIIKLGHQLLVYVVDVSGSGIDGAFINIFIRQKINRFLYVDMLHEEISPKLLINFLATEFVKEKFPDEYFICLYACVYDIEKKAITYSNAGIQVPPALIKDGEIIEMSLGGLPISAAIDRELLIYEEETISFDKGSTLLISTDGIVESEINGKMYGVQRLHQLVIDNYYLPPKELKNLINMDIEPILNNNKAHDDITYVIMQHSEDIVAEQSYVINSECMDVETLVTHMQHWLEAYTDEVNSILVGFNEMLYNAIEHGNKFDASKQVKINIEIHAKYIKIIIEDEGDGFDWRSRMLRQLDIMNFEERGRGIIFTKASFEYFTYNEKGNIAYLYKKL